MTISGGPNGAAFGPDAALYICNDGGFTWLPLPPPPAKSQLRIATTQAADYTGGKLQRVDLGSGAVSDLITASTSPTIALRGPDDLVLDGEGGCWITDWGKIRARDRDVTSVFYLAPDGRTLRQSIPSLNLPNGIALSPHGACLYVALSFERRILNYEVAAGGSIKPNPRTLDGSYLITGDFIVSSVLDSMAVDERGNLYVATMLPQGADPSTNGGITVVSPEGEILDYVEIKLPDDMPVPLPSNICFGGADMQTAYITCGGTGYLISMPALVPGLRLHFNG